MAEKKLHDSESGEKGAEALPASVRIRRGAVRMMHKAFSGVKGAMSEGMKEPDTIKGLTGLIAYGPVALFGMFGRATQIRWHSMIGKARGQKMTNMMQFITGADDKPRYEAKSAQTGPEAGSPAA